MKQLPILFSDLDGTLLDHHSYSYEAAKPALARLRRAGIPLVLNTSKTVAEVLAIREDLDNRHPFVVENGSALLIPQAYFPSLDEAAFEPFSQGDEALLIHYFGQPYKTVCDALYGLRARLKLKFRGFAEMSDNEVAELTGLDLPAAGRARGRLSAEPIYWQDTVQAKERFRQGLARCGLSLVQGGRFLHVMSKVDKALGLDWLMRCYTSRYQAAQPLGSPKLISVALGDSPNDLGMLKASDIAVVIPPASGATLAISRERRVLRPKQPGPAGWQAAVDRILSDHAITGVHHG